MIGSILLVILGVILVSVIFSFIGAGIVWLVWDKVIEQMFNAPDLGFWQIWAIMLAIGIIANAFKANVTVNK